MRRTQDKDLPFSGRQLGPWCFLNSLRVSCVAYFRPNTNRGLLLREMKHALTKLRQTPPEERMSSVRFRNSRSKVACSPSAVFYVDLSPTLIAGRVDRRHIEMFPILSCNNSARLNSMFMARFRVHGAYTLCHTYIAFCVTVYIYIYIPYIVCVTHIAC